MFRLDWPSPGARYSEVSRKKSALSAQCARDVRLRNDACAAFLFVRSLSVGTLTRLLFDIKKRLSAAIGLTEHNSVTL